MNERRTTRRSAMRSAAVELSSAAAPERTSDMAAAGAIVPGKSCASMSGKKNCQARSPTDWIA